MQSAKKLPFSNSILECLLQFILACYMLDNYSSNSNRCSVLFLKQACQKTYLIAISQDDNAKIHLAQIMKDGLAFSHINWPPFDLNITDCLEICQNVSAFLLFVSLVMNMCMTPSGSALMPLHFFFIE